MVKRKILKAELRRYIRDTPFTRDEVQRLWNRFNQMDSDGRGQLNYQVTCQAIYCACKHTCLVSLETCNQQCHSHSTNDKAHWHIVCVFVQETARVDELRCNPFSARIVYLFSEDGSGELTFQKFINMMSVFSGRTSRQTKAVWAFALWDFDGKCQVHPLVATDILMRIGDTFRDWPCNHMVQLQSTNKV